MVAAIAFACIQSDDILVRRVEFTEEFKACLPFLRFSGLGHEPVDTVAGEADAAIGEPVEQHLHVAHAATASIVLPPLAFLRYASDDALADPTIYLRAFGICLQERGGARNRPAAIPLRPGPGQRPLDRLTDVVDNVVRDGEYFSATDAHSPFRFAASVVDPLGSRATREGGGDLRIIAANKIRALLLAEPPSYGSACSLRLYTDTDRPSPPRVVMLKSRVRA
jgi:hypothetical protein